MKKRIIINSLERIDVIKADQIMYINSCGKYSTFVLSDKRKITSSMNLGSYLDDLPEEMFVRIHNSYVININYIQYIEKGENWDLILTDSTKIPISRRKKEELLNKL